MEIYDHLTSLKQEFLDQGKSEEEATTLAIQNFGEASTLGTEIEKRCNLLRKNMCSGLAGDYFTVFIYFII